MTGSSPQDLAVAFRSFPRRLSSVLEGAEDDAHRTSAGPLVQQLDTLIRDTARGLDIPASGDTAAVAVALADGIEHRPAKAWTDEELEQVRRAALEAGGLLRRIEAKVTE